jgi:hypothetical protein
VQGAGCGFSPGAAGASPSPKVAAPPQVDTPSSFPKAATFASAATSGRGRASANRGSENMLQDGIASCVRKVDVRLDIALL